MKLQTLKIRFCNFYDKMRQDIKKITKVIPDAFYVNRDYFSRMKVIFVQLAAAVVLWIISFIVQPSSRYLFT
jgi:hypothetical protein